MARRWAEEGTFTAAGDISTWRFTQTPYGFQILDAHNAEVRWCGKVTLRSPPRRYKDDVANPRQVEIQGDELLDFLKKVHEKANAALGLPLESPIKNNMFREEFARAKEYPQTRWQDAAGEHVDPESFQPGEVWVLLRVVPYSVKTSQGLSVRLCAMQR